MNDPRAKPLSVLWFILLLVPGCALLQRPVEPTQTTPQHYPLLAPDTYGGTFAAQQMLEGKARGQHFQLHTYIEIDPIQIQVLGFTPWQTRAFVLRYDGDTLEFENLTNREIPFPPAHILADVQQVLWPQLPSQGPWRVVDGVERRDRQVYFRDQLMTHIQYNENFVSSRDIMLSNIPFDYQLRIHITRNE